MAFNSKGTIARSWNAYGFFYKSFSLGTRVGLQNMCFCKLTRSSFRKRNSSSNKEHFVRNSFLIYLLNSLHVWFSTLRKIGTSIFLLRSHVLTKNCWFNEKKSTCPNTITKARQFIKTCRKRQLFLNRSRSCRTARMFSATGQKTKTKVICRKESLKSYLKRELGQKSSWPPDSLFLINEWCFYVNRLR